MGLDPIRSWPLCFERKQVAPDCLPFGTLILPPLMPEQSDTNGRTSPAALPEYLDTPWIDRAVLLGPLQD